MTVHAPVTSLAYSLNNKWIAIGRRDGTLHLHTKINGVKPANIAELISQEDVDGALVGGASLEVDSFFGIIKGAEEHVRDATA